MSLLVRELENRALRSLWVMVNLFVAGCATVGPDYRGPTPPPMPSAYLRSADQPATAPPVSWARIDDGTLQGLILHATQNNPGVEELIWRIEEARSVVQIVSGQRQPFADAITGYERRKRSSNSQPFVASNGQPFNFFSVGVNSRWEIDIVGRIARETEASIADHQAAREDLLDLKRVLAGDIARAYVQLRLNQALLQENQNNLRSQQDSISEVEARIEAGNVSRLDLFQLQARIGLTKSDSPVFAQAAKQSYHQVALLAGRVPDGYFEDLQRPAPQISVTVHAPEVPANLLRRRPDIRGAEREVAAACARIGVAEAEFYPRLNLLGTISFDSRRISNLLEYDSLAFTIGPGISWNILSLGRIESQVRIQEAQLKQAIARYRQAVIAAAREVEDALAAQQLQHHRIRILKKTVEDARKAVEFALDQYKANKVSLERVVSNQTRLLRSSLELARARADAATAAIDLCQALGGGEIEMTPWQMAVCGCLN